MVTNISSQGILKKIQSQSPLRYGDTSPWKCYLLHSENGYNTVITENGDIIYDLAGWFVPWDNKTGGMHDANEREPAQSH